MGMNEFDRVLQRHNMNLLGPIYLIKHGGESGCFAAAGCAGNEDDAIFFLHDLFEHRR